MLMMMGHATKIKLHRHSSRRSQICIMKDKNIYIYTQQVQEQEKKERPDTIVHTAYMRASHTPYIVALLFTNKYTLAETSERAL